MYVPIKYCFFVSSAWQHVDCMGIDRQNIPDEYHCEACKPRPVDRIRARALQLLKRKEQQNFLLLNNPKGLTPQQLAATTPLPIDGLPAHIALVGNVLPLETQLPTTNHIAKSSKAKPSNAKSRKPISNSGDPSVAANNKRKRSESSSRGSLNGKRRDSKKVSNSKRRSTKQSANPAQSTSNSADSNLRQWIENYETAMTNHYSPELRARLQAIGKQQQQQNVGHHPHLKNVHQLESGKCTIVPHAGGKILISTLDLIPTQPVIEIQGKYMLSGQYKQQQHIGGQAGRNPGPFLFFYRLPNDGPEICVDTRTYGNEARFVRRSCRPNAEILHTIEKGTIHLYIVSLTLIRSSTEITIRHEPHDLIGISDASLTAPTSTICACGLTKDCVFSSIPPAAPELIQTPLSPKTVTSPLPTKPNRVNGNLILDDSGLAATPVPPPPPPNNNKINYKRNKSTQNRNRSTSSSGDSNAGMLSPTHQHMYTNIPISATSAAHIQMVSDPAGFYMSSSSSSPPVSLASPSLPSPIAGQAASNLLTSPITYQQVTNQGHPALPMEIVQSPQHTPHHQAHQQSTEIHPITKQMVELPPATIHLVPAIPKQTPPVSPAPTPFNTGGFASPPPSSVIQLSICTTITTSTASVPSPILPPATLSLVPTPTVENYPNQSTQFLVVPDVEPLITVTAMQQQSLRPSSLILDELTTTETLAESPRSQTRDEPPLSPPLPKITSPIKSPAKNIPPPPSSSSHKKSPRKTTLSFSEDSSSMAGDEHPTTRKEQETSQATTSTPVKRLTSEESKKMTREERKMQAIMKAFEKMEKNQLRKQELKQNKCSSASMTNAPSSVAPTQRPSEASPTSNNGTTGTNDDQSHTARDTSPSKKSSSQSQRRKKRKGTKSYPHTTQTRKKTRNHSNSGDSDVPTSEDSTTLLSPNISISTNYPNTASFIPARSSPNENHHKSDTAAASMLISLASHCKTLEGGDDNARQMNSPIHNIRRSLSDQTTPPSFPLSSACMFIEAAVAPFEQTNNLDNSEFKMPPKTKTKKTRMNEWLHQSVGTEPTYGSPVQHFEQEEHHNSAHIYTIPTEQASTPSSIINMPEEPQNLSMAAQRIVDFINTSTGGQDESVGSECRWTSSSVDHSNLNTSVEHSSSSQYTTPILTTVMTVPPAFPTPPMQCGSSVKKRWLRQAISEECSDDLTAPPNGYMTPLKKRRIARECSAAVAAATLTDSCPATEQVVLR